MGRDLAKPRDAGVFHRDGGIEALGDGAGYDCLTLLREQHQQLFLLGNQRIDLRRPLI